MLLGVTGCSGMNMDTVLDAVIDGTKTPAQKKKEKGNEEFRKIRKSWIGNSADNLVLKWGNPNSIYQRQDGGSQYTWKRYQYDSWNNSYLCIDNFITDSAGIIKQWTTNGGCYY